MDDFKERIEKVEETLAFSERNQDELSEQLVRAYDALERLGRRLGVLEDRLGAIEAPLTDPEDEVADLSAPGADHTNP